ncbi:MAG: PQQ-dependent sugar dehydrogenase [Solirubrobacteraceae bacterium]
MATLMRAAIAILLVLAAGLGVAYVASGGQDDPLAELEPLQPATESGRAHHFDVERIAEGLNRPTWVGGAPGDRALWVLEQPGRVVRVDGRRRDIVLDLRDRVRVGAEQGLLGVAFHPDFARDRRLYLHWSDRKGDTRVAEFRARRDGTIAPKPVRQLLFLDQPEENHNGGQLLFGPDGRLYLGLGDGGGAFDPRRTAQDGENLLGKIVAADVDARQPVWKPVVTGLRNPWRFSFDAALGELWIGDVGQDAVEEIDRVLPEPDEPPKNLGWSAYEGTERIGGHDLDRTGELIWPVAAYTHADGCSVTGGVVYAGSELTALGRRYVYGDFCSGSVWTLAGTPEGRAADVRREQAKVPGLTHIGTDRHGELVFASGNGGLYRAVPAGS